MENITPDMVVAALSERVGTGKWVSMSDLRDAYGCSMDALTEIVSYLMSHCPSVDVVSEDNQKALTVRDHANAVRIGGRWLHYLRIR